MRKDTATIMPSGRDGVADQRYPFDLSRLLRTIDRAGEHDYLRGSDGICAYSGTDHAGDYDITC